MFLENDHWIPAVFDAKKKKFITEINGLPKNSETKSLYTSLGQIFNSLIPSFEQTLDISTKQHQTWSFYGGSKNKFDGFVEVNTTLCAVSLFKL